MKKFILLFLLVVSGFVLRAQYPVNQYLGSDSTLVTSRGALKSRIVVYNFVDTFAANLQRIRQYPFAIIGTTLDSSFWYRNQNATRWVRFLSTNNLGSEFFFDSTCNCFKIDTSFLNNYLTNFIDSSQNGGVINISILNDSTLIVCRGDGTCDTIHISTTINNISSVSFLNDSTAVVCGLDTTQIPPITVCDTISIGKQPIVYLFENGLRMPSPKVVHWGGDLVEPTSINNNNNVLSWNGAQIYGYPWQYNNLYFSQIGTGFLSFKGHGYYYDCCSNDNGNYYVNSVKLGIQYLGGNYIKPSILYPSGISGYLGTDSLTGYSFGTNWIGAGSYGAYVDDFNSKTTGLFIHTTDTVNNSAVTIYGAPQRTANQANETYSIVNGNGLGNYKIAEFKTNKDLQFYGYPNTRHDGLPTNVLYTDVNGNVKADTLHGGNITISGDTTIICSFGTNLCDTFITSAFSGLHANNGLTLLGVDSVQLGSDNITGSPLLHTTYINTDATFSLIARGTGVATVLTGQNTSAGIGVYGESSSGYGIFGFSLTGTGGKIQANPTSVNTVLPILEVNRGLSGGGTAANGIGGSIDMYIQNASSFQRATQLISKLTDATNPTRTSQFIITGVNNAVTSDLLTLSGNGGLQLNKYGIGSFTSGTATYLIATDASGNYIEVPASGLSGGNIITADNGLTANTSTNVQLGGTLLQNTTIDATGSFLLTVTGANTGTNSTMFIHNTSTGHGLISTADGAGYGVFGTGFRGVYGVSTTGFGVRGNATSGSAIYGSNTTGITGILIQTPTTANDVTTVLQVAKLTSGNSGNGQNGIGGAIDFALPTSTSGGLISTTVGSIYVKLTDATHASRTTATVLTGTLNTTTVDLLTLAGDGSVKLRPITATAASAITPAEGMMLFTSDTDGTFTSVGFWGYQGGSWIKM